MANTKNTEKKDDKVMIEVEPEVVETVAEKKEDKVLIMIPYVEGQGSELTVGVNGVFTKIKKGVMVEVPRPVAEVIMNSQQQAMVAEANQERMKMQVQDLG